MGESWRAVGFVGVDAQHGSEINGTMWQGKAKIKQPKPDGN